MKPDLNLSKEQIALSQTHGLTFRPVSRGRLVCNQAPGLGRLSPRQANSLRGQVWPAARREKT